MTGTLSPLFRCSYGEKPAATKPTFMEICMEKVNHTITISQTLQCEVGCFLLSLNSITFLPDAQILAYTPLREEQLKKDKNDFSSILPGTLVDRHVMQINV